MAVTMVLHVAVQQHHTSHNDLSIIYQYRISTMKHTDTLCCSRHCYGGYSLLTTLHRTIFYHRQVFCQAEQQQSAEVPGTYSSGNETSALLGQLQLHTCRNTADPISASPHHLRSSAVAEKSFYVTKKQQQLAVDLFTATDHNVMWQ